jgi:hypothetical protein
MTQQHPITPPPGLVEQWMQDHATKYDLARHAAQWGSDQELEACCEWLSVPCPSYGRELRNARRPKTPSLKELALKSLKDIGDACESEGFCRANEMDIIRRALESINE